MLDRRRMRNTPKCIVASLKAELKLFPFIQPNWLLFFSLFLNILLSINELRSSITIHYANNMTIEYSTYWITK